MAPCTTQGLGGDVSKMGNVASMKSKGLEFTLSATPIKTKDFTWTTNVIYSHSTTEVTDFNSTTRLISLVSGNGFTMKGYPVRALFSLQFKGLNEEGLPTFLDTDGNTTSLIPTPSPPVESTCRSSANMHCETKRAEQCLQEVLPKFIS